MKIVLSRKGFDSKYGGCASPILPDGRLVSLPIPTRDRSSIRYGELQVDGIDVGALVVSLSRGRVAHSTKCHLDPDLARSILPRQGDWRPAFGQTGRAQRHLKRQDVGVGDLFLYFGWFRAVRQDTPGRWAYDRHSADLHHLFGWLQVGEIIHLGAKPARLAERHPDVANHAHFSGEWDAENTLYVAGHRLNLPGLRDSIPGAGVFRRADTRLRLTAPGATRSMWNLPDFFHPRPNRPPLSFHGRAERWQRTDEGVRLRSAAIGQEFVLDIVGMDEASSWLAALFEPEVR